MIKKIVAFTVVVLFTFLLSCGNTNKGILFFAPSLSANNITHSFEQNTLSTFSNFNFSDAFRSLFIHSDKEKEKENKDVRISDYDELIQRISFDHGHDWRFISAIAYNESRFNPNAVSRVGAKGIMQIMPIVAKQFNVSQDKVFEPETNIKLANKLLNKLEDMLKFAPEVSEHDKMSIILACYNGGIGHVSDARRLAKKYGANPDSWQDVSRYLELKANADYHQDDVVWYGYFRGSKETLGFVSKVMSKYDSYCQL